MRGRGPSGKDNGEKLVNGSLNDSTPFELTCVHYKFMDCQTCVTIGMLKLIISHKNLLVFSPIEDHRFI